MMREEYNMLSNLYQSLVDISLVMKKYFECGTFIIKFTTVIRSPVIADKTMAEIGNFIKEQITDEVESDLSKYSYLFNLITGKEDISFLVVWDRFMGNIDDICKDIANIHGEYACRFTLHKKFLWDKLSELFSRISQEFIRAIDFDLIYAEKFLIERYCKEDETRNDSCYMLREIRQSYSPAISYNKDPSLVSCAVFAPTSMSRNDSCLIQVFIYENQFSSEIAQMAEMVDPDAKKRDYMPLNYKLSEGDRVKIIVEVVGGRALALYDNVSEQVWQGGVIKHVAWLQIPQHYDSSSFIGKISLFINDIPVGEMKFRTIVDVIRGSNTWAEVESLKYRSSFISFMSEDLQSILFLAEGFRIQKELNGIDYFFSKHTLKNGDDYPEKIEEYINSCDVFILCWSKNAQKSEWVEKEYNLAVHRYRSRKDIALRIYNIVPKAPLPPILSEQFHIEELG